MPHTIHNTANNCERALPYTIVSAHCRTQFTMLQTIVSAHCRTQLWAHNAAELSELLSLCDQTITSSYNCERTMPRTIHNAAHNSQCHAQLQPMWLCIFLSWCFEDAFKNAQWRKVKQMRPVWLCLLWSKFFMETFENTQWRKFKQMQPMWLCILSDRQFEDTFENTHWRMQAIWGGWKYTAEKS